MALGKNKLGIIVALTSLLVLPSCANENVTVSLAQIEEVGLPSTLPDIYLGQFQNNSERIQKQFVDRFLNLNRQGPVTRERLLEVAEKQFTQSRVRAMTKYLTADTNGDSLIEGKELVALGRISSGMSLEDADINSDNKITMEEMLAHSRKLGLKALSQRPSMDTTLIVFDENKDDVVEQSELVAGLRNIAEKITGEKEAVNDEIVFGGKRRVEVKKKKPVRPQCKVPTLNKNADVIFLGAYMGAGLSSVDVTQGNGKTEVSRLFIEPGDTKLIVVASSVNSLIWVVEGDTSRISKFIAQPSFATPSGVGVVGLTKKQVSFIGKSCLSKFYTSNSSDSVLAKGTWTKIVGREPTNMIGERTPRNLKLPSGENGEKRKHNLKNTRRGSGGVDPKLSLYNGHEDGLVEIDPSSVISPNTVATYLVMPASAGILQLMKEGKIEQLSDGAYKIIKPIPHFPPGLSNTNGVRFILAKGVPVPEGNPGRSRVYSEETGQCVVINNQCRK